jgi:outer membrane protein TolC
MRRDLKRVEHDVCVGGPARFQRWQTVLAPLLMLLLLLLMAGLSPARAQALDLSLEQARSLVQAGSDKLRAAAEDINRRELDAKAAETLGYPDLQIGLNQVYGRKDIEISPVPFIGSINTTASLDGPRSPLTSTWPIYTGGKISAVQAALAAEVQASTAQRRSVEEQIERELVQRYFGLRLTRQLLALREQQLAQAERQLVQATAFETQGQISRVERLNSQVARDDAAREVNRARSDDRIAEAALRRMLRADQALNADTPLFVLSASLPPLVDWQADAARANPLLATLDAKTAVASQGVQIAKSEFMPSIGAFADYELIRNYLSLIEPNWKAGIGISFKLFSREDRQSKVGAAGAQQRQVEAQRAEVANEIKLAVEAHWMRVEQAREQFQLLDSSLELTRENLRLRERGFAEGQATSLDVNEARNAVTRVELGRAQVAYDYVVALASLLETTGQSRRFDEFQRQARIRF